MLVTLIPNIRNSNANVPLLQRNSTLVNELDTIYNGIPEEYEDSADCCRGSYTVIKAVRVG